MKRVKLFTLVGGLITGLSAISAYAVLPLPCGIYAEANVGGSSINKNYGANINTSNVNSVAWNINGGYKIMPFFAVEGGVTSYANTNLNNPNNDQFGVDRHWGYDIAVKGILPLAASGFEVFGKVGGIRLYSSTKITNAANNTIAFNATKNSSNSLFYGAGAEYFFMPTVAVNAQWQRAQGTSKTGVLSLYSLGVSWIIY